MAKEKLFLTEKDKLIIRATKPPKRVELSCGVFYVNSVDVSRFVYEKILEKLAAIFGLTCAHYHLVDVGRNDENLVVISEDLNKDGKLYEMSTFIKEDEESITSDAAEARIDFSMYSLWHAVESRFSFSFKNVVEIVKAYILDILCNNSDRNFTNIGLLVKQNGERHVTLLDNEYTFDKSTNRMKLTSEYAALLLPSAENDLKHFLKESNVEFIDLFLYYFDLVTPELLKSIIEEIKEEEDIAIPEEEKILTSFVRHRYKLECAMQEVWGDTFFRPLHRIDLDKIKNAGNGVVQIGGRNYFVKKTIPRTCSCELLGMRLAKLMGISTPNYRVVMIDGDCYIISEEIPNLVRGLDLNIQDNTLNNVDGRPEVSKGLMSGFVHMYLFDILFLNGDRNNKNWAVQDNENQKSLYALDHGHLFSSYYPLRFTMEKESDVNLYFDEDEALKDAYEELSAFFCCSSEEYLRLFQEMMDKARPAVLEEFICQIEAEGFPIADKKSIIELYRKHYSNLEKLLAERTKANERR